MSFPTIIFEDDSLLVVDKPAGLVVNSSITARAPTLQDMLRSKYPDMVGNEEFMSRSGIVHRLDRDTSGLLLVAKTDVVFEELKSQFKARTVEKVYQAIVYGQLEDQEFEIDAPIKRNPKRRTQFIVAEDGKPAVTLISLFKSTQTFSWLIVKPKTGRTHQIRVHLSALGHSVVGDRLYASNHQLHESSQIFTRLMLHANTISLLYRGEKVVFESKLPSEFQL